MPPCNGNFKTSFIKSQSVPISALKILIADDNVDAANLLSSLLKLDGHTVWIAHDGEAAITMAEMKRPQVILLDLGMPKMTGYDACKRIRASLGEELLLAVAVTGMGMDDARASSKEAGFDRHITKPANYSVIKFMLDGVTNNGPANRVFSDIGD